MTKREKLLQHFQNEYNRLNEAQRRAVDRTEGPVMVIAGPGTGKTQILSARIGKILLSDAQVDPSNILCLTYTEAGAVAMRKRLQHFIGADAHRVAIHTFHAFCHDVIQDHLSHFNKLSLEPVSDLERKELLHRLIDSFGPEHPLKRASGDPYYEAGPMQELFALMKKEGWTPEFIAAQADAYIADLPNREEYVYKRKSGPHNKGDLKQDKIDEAQQKMKRLKAAAFAFYDFQKRMDEKHRYDFDDMINWVITAFEQHPDLLMEYQEQYQYILVDEYQDTSGAQNTIVKLLTNFFEAQSNVFVVGDDDQSIYRFQGANIENMMGFAKSFSKDLFTVVLTNNYRSAQPILDVSKSLIERNQERLLRVMQGLDKNLISSHPAVKNIVQKPEVHECDTQREEMIHIVQHVEAAIAAGTRPCDIGIIYKENKYGDELMRYFQLKTIPYYTRRPVNILKEPIIAQLVKVLDYLAAEHHVAFSGDELLFEILHFEWFAVPPVEIAKASMRVAEIQFKKGQTSLRQWILEQAAAPQKDLFDAGINKALAAAMQQIENLIGAVPNEPLQGLLEKLVREGGFLNHIMHHPEKIWLLQLVTAFYQHLKNETARMPELTLAGFTESLRLMRKEGIPLPLTQVAGSERGVNLMTAHGSKGLEFETVFVAGCNSKFWEGKRKQSAKFTFPDTLFESRSQENETEELRRLFYVALTRAKRKLVISYSNWEEGSSRQMEQSAFVAEVLEDHALEIKTIKLKPEVIEAFSILHFMENKRPEIAKLDDELTQRIVSNFVLSLSSLNHYLRCPLEFYFRNIVRIPSPRSDSMEFGSAVHHALESLYEKMLAHPQNAFPPVEDFISYFAWDMRRRRAAFTPQQFNDRMEYGVAVLQQYYAFALKDACKVVRPEHHFRNVTVGDVVLKGTIDKIEFYGREAVIVDYKTGKADNARKKAQRPTGANPEGGDYWRQAVFYKMLFEAATHHERPVREVVFDLVEPDKQGRFERLRIAITPQDEMLVKEQIEKTLERIQNHDFYTGCGKEECPWCTFVKTSQMAIALHEIDSEEIENTRRVM